MWRRGALRPGAPPPSPSGRTLKSLSLSQSAAAERLSVHMHGVRVQTGSRTSCGIYYSEWVNAWITKHLFFFLKKNIFLFHFLPTSELEKQPAIMSRAPDEVSKLTESTYKVSDQLHDSNEEIINRLCALFVKRNQLFKVKFWVCCLLHFTADHESRKAVLGSQRAVVCMCFLFYCLVFREVLLPFITFSFALTL